MWANASRNDDPLPITDGRKRYFLGARRCPMAIDDAREEKTHHRGGRRRL